jgi:transposase-like protein
VGGDGGVIARTLNEDRRQLTKEQRLPMVKQLLEDGHTQRSISGALGVPKSTVNDDIQELRKEQLPGSGQLKEPDRNTGLVGKSYPSSPAHTRSPATPPGEGRGDTYSTRGREGRSRAECP